MKETFQKIHECIQAGKTGPARQSLKKLAELSIPREFLLTFANLARRADLSELGVRALYPFVRLEKNPRRSATESEKAEYAACLIKIGAVQEGISLLKELDYKLHPEALLFLAYGQIKEWNYSEAIAVYEKYLTLSSPSESQKRIVKNNLAAALMQEGKFLRAQQLLKGERDLPESLVELQKLHSPNPNINELRHSAQGKKHWEFIRICDLVEAKSTKNEAILEKLYYGSPFAAFRERVERVWNSKPEKLHFYDWSIGDGNGAKVKLDLFGKLKPGNATYQLLAILLSDFYRPFQTARIGEHLFPGEEYDPYRTPNRVQQNIARLRKWLKAENFPISLESTHGAYSWASHRNVSIRVVFQTSTTAWDYSIQLLQNKFSEEFDAQAAAQLLKCSTDTVVIYLNRAIVKGICERTGKGRAIKYRFLNLQNSDRIAA